MKYTEADFALATIAVAINEQFTELFALRRENDRLATDNKKMRDRLLQEVVVHAENSMRFDPMLDKVPEHNKAVQEQMMRRAARDLADYMLAHDLIEWNWFKDVEVGGPYCELRLRAKTLILPPQD